MTQNYEAFLKRYPEYKQTASIDQIRLTDYARLDAQKHVYLDYTGAGLYATSQIEAHTHQLRDHIFGNPHSSNPSSMAATKFVDSARDYVLKYFNADPVEYDVIFTSNASGALKIVGESYPFGQGDQYVLAFDNHNSVNGIREFAHTKGADVKYIPLALPELRLDEEVVAGFLRGARQGQNNLFAYPAQSNFTSVKHPLRFIELAHQYGWDVLLDAAAFAPTNRLDLSIAKPEFVSLSFYKIFGYPTGIGALVAKRSALRKLHKPWFAGGTITVASVQGDKFYLADGHAAFEDGTLDFLSIPAIEIGLKHIQKLGIDQINTRVKCLTGWLLSNLTEMKHSSGVPLVKVYGPTDTTDRGGAVTVNFYDPHGRAIDHRSIEESANQRNISVRTGCFCNPGAGEIALGISRVELDVCFSGPGHEDRLTIDDFRDCISGKSSGAVRVSIGTVTNFADVEAFLRFAEGLLD